MEELKVLKKLIIYQKIHDGVMVGRLIQNNPFSLLKVDKLFFNTKTEGVLYQKIILEYFQYIKTNIGQ